MKRLIEKLNDALAELTSAHNMLPQDAPYHHIKLAEVHLQSVAADLATQQPAADPGLVAWEDAAKSLGVDTPAALVALVSEQAAHNGRLQTQLAAALAGTVPAAETAAL